MLTTERVVTERRQAPRVTVKGLAYVNLDRDNGGIILDVSEGGLCFQATAPVQCIEKVRLWFSYRSSRTQADALKQDGQTRDIPGFVETESELTWTDDTRKRGGLKFKNLSAEARSQIRDWIRQPSLANASEKSTASFPSVYKRPVLNAKGAETTAAAADSPRLDSSRSHALRFDLSRFDALSRHIRSGKLWTGFSGGVMAGLLVSAIVVSVFMLMSHGRELGDSLIRLGERLGGRSWVALPEQRSAATELKPVSLESKMTAAQPQTFAVPEQVQRPQAKEYVSANLPAPAKLAADKIDPDRLAKAAREATNPHVIPGSFSLSGPTEPNHSVVNPTGSRPLSPDIVVAPVPEPSANLFPATAALSAAEIAPVSRPGVHIEPAKAGSLAMRSEKYLEVGRFKEKMLALKTTGQLSQLGFPATVVQQSHFLGKSYQVLVGPYESDPDAQTVHKNLATLGFTPRSYERGRRDFSLPAALKVGSTRLPVGDCMITWESYTPNAIVKFEDEKGMTITVEGKWRNQPNKNSENAVVYMKNRDGSRTLLEIRFSRMGQALVFAGG